MPTVILSLMVRLLLLVLVHIKQKPVHAKFRRRRRLIMVDIITTNTPPARVSSTERLFMKFMLGLIIMASLSLASSRIAVTQFGDKLPGKLRTLKSAT